MRFRNLVILLGCVGLTAEKHADAGGVGALAAYNGTWKIEVTVLDTPFSKAGLRSQTLKNDCWGSGDYYVCHQIVDGDSKALVVFTFDQKQNSYASYPITIGSDAVHAGRLIIDGNKWTFPWELTDKGHTTYFHVVNVFSTPTTIDYFKEYSEDGEHWQFMEKGRETRVP
jgi:hypothetical protein